MLQRTVKEFVRTFWIIALVLLLCYSRQEQIFNNISFGLNYLIVLTILFSIAFMYGAYQKKKYELLDYEINNGQLSLVFFYKNERKELRNILISNIGVKLIYHGWGIMPKLNWLEIYDLNLGNIILKQYCASKASEKKLLELEKKLKDKGSKSL